MSLYIVSESNDGIWRAVLKTQWFKTQSRKESILNFLFTEREHFIYKSVPVKIRARENKGQNRGRQRATSWEWETLMAACFDRT